MNRKAMRTLNDGPAQHHGKTITCITEVMVDFNIERAGVEGVFMTSQVGITFRKAELVDAPRGSYFIHDCRRFVVEEEIFNDGAFVTVACMEQR